LDEVSEGRNLPAQSQMRIGHQPYDRWTRANDVISDVYSVSGRYISDGRYIVHRGILIRN
jgi:hypothetical protein